MQWLFALGLMLLLSACDIETSNNLPGVPATGFYAVVVANEHEGLDDVQVGVAIYADGEPINLTGGDVVRASNATGDVLLLQRGFYKGSYVANLPNPSILDRIDFEIVHDPIQARQNRWYPVELLNIDPGPGELVGSSASVIMPPAPVIIGNLDGSTYQSINETLNLGWLAGAANDEVRVRSVVSCDNGAKTTSYGTDVQLNDTSDDGFESIPLDQFIYDITQGNPAFEFIKDEVRALLQETLLKLSGGKADALLVEGLLPLNPVESDCDIQVFLYRKRPVIPASPKADFSGSRSADITIHYTPPTPFTN
jgi:hypothetical protein